MAGFSGVFKTRNQQAVAALVDSGQYLTRKRIMAMYGIGSTTVKALFPDPDKTIRATGTETRLYLRAKVEQRMREYLKGRVGN